MFTTRLLGHYIPLTWLSFGVNYVLGGMNPWGYHLGNVLLHAAGAGVFYLVARRLLAAGVGGGVAAPAGPMGAGSLRDPAVCLGAAFAALAFGVHPLRVESVAWVTERRDVLCGLFYLLAVWAYLRGVAGGGPIATRWWALSLGAFAAALLSKSISMPLGAVLLLLDVYPLRRVGAMGWRRLVIEKLPYLVLGALGAGVALLTLYRAIPVTAYGAYGPAARVAMSAYSLVFYAWKFLWAGGLSPMHELPERVDALEPRFLLAMALVVAVTAILIALRRRWPGGLAAWVYSALMILPVGGGVHAGLHLVADRYSYLSGLGFAVLAGSGLAWLVRERTRLRSSVVTLAVAAAALIVIGWGAGAWRQSKVWHDSERLWGWALELDPQCAMCATNLGAALIMAPEPGLARARQAEALLRHAIRLRPERAFTYHPLGVALALQGRYAEAETVFEEYARRDPDSVMASVDLGVVRLQQGHHAEAIPFLRRALAMNPAYQNLRPVLARALRERSEALRGEGKAGEADALVSEAQAVLAGAP